jgi:hypothetical protein
MTTTRPGCLAILCKRITFPQKADKAQRAT